MPFFSVVEIYIFKRFLKPLFAKKDIFIHLRDRLGEGEISSAKFFFLSSDLFV